MNRIKEEQILKNWIKKDLAQTIAAVTELRNTRAELIRAREQNLALIDLARGEHPDDVKLLLRVKQTEDRYSMAQNEFDEGKKIMGAEMKRMQKRLIEYEGLISHNLQQIAQLKDAQKLEITDSQQKFII
ncbi:MAG: hypothetical protein EZS28_028941, partial [Streblomastix strix]